MADGIQKARALLNTPEAVAVSPWAALGADRTERLCELVLPLTRTIVAGDSFLVDNPMGLRPPASAARTD